ncbi:MAG: hypothetical protein Q8R20_00185 [Nanoarchaeota archaeon]|nr:hypothetical protein [Nanoarchaeota archaeon]
MRIEELLPEDLREGIEGEIEIPEWAFMPDAWTWTFARGLKQAQLTTETVWEIGVGTGIVQILLRRWFPGATRIFSDYDARCTKLAMKNLTTSAPLEDFLKGRDFPLFGRWNLVKSGRNTPPKADIVIGCIPQVPCPKNVVLGEGDTLAHYYNAEEHPGHNHSLGLGLVEDLLRQAQGVALPKNGRVILNLGGRPGIKRLTNLFVVCGYEPRVIHKEIVRQHAQTDLRPLAEMEMSGEHRFEFFLSPEGKGCIGAMEAAHRLSLRESVYHYIYVIEGRLA